MKVGLPDSAVHHAAARSTHTHRRTAEPRPAPSYRRTQISCRAAGEGKRLRLRPTARRSGGRPGFMKVGLLGSAVHHATARSTHTYCRTRFTPYTTPPPHRTLQHCRTCPVIIYAAHHTRRRPEPSPTGARYARRRHHLCYRRHTHAHAGGTA